MQSKKFLLTTFTSKAVVYVLRYIHHRLAFRMPCSRIVKKTTSLGYRCSLARLRVLRDLYTNPAIDPVYTEASCVMGNDSPSELEILDKIVLAQL